MATPALRGSTGRYLGEVTRVSGNKLYFNSRDSLHIGDRIRIQPGSDKVGTAFTLKQLWAGAKAVKKMTAGPVCVANPFGPKFKTGDAVFKVSSQQAFSMSDVAARRKLGQVKAVKQPLTLNVNLNEHQMVIVASVGELKLEVAYPVEFYPAQTSPLSQQTLTQVFEQTAQAPFELQELIAADLPDVVVPPKRLKEIRRDFYTHLQHKIDQHNEEQLQQCKQRAIASLLQPAPSYKQRGELVVAVRDLREMRALDQPDVDKILVPLTPAVLHRRWRVNPTQCRGVVWDIPFVIFDQDWRTIQQAVHCLVDAGFRNFRLNNLSHFALFKNKKDMLLQTGYRLFCLNTQAMLSWQEFGAVGSEMYIEDEQQNMAQLLKRSGDYPLRAVIYTAVPLITSRIRISGVKSDAPLISDRGDEYKVLNKGGLTVVQSQRDFSLTGELGLLHDMGCASYLADISHLGVFSKEGQQVLDAVRGGRGIANTELFNFNSGLE